MSKASTLARAVSTGGLLSDGTLSQAEVTTALGYTPESSANKNQNNGYAGLDGSGKVASAQLPSYVDDVIEAANSAALPATGETSKIYITLDNNKVYRWSGSSYVEIVATPGSTDSVSEGSTNLYFTNTRARSAVSASTASGVSYNSSTGVFSLASIPNSSLANNSITINGSSVSLGSSTTISVSPGGATTQVQYNNAGVFAGSANFVFDGTNVGIGASSPADRLDVRQAGVAARFTSTNGNANQIALSNSATAVVGFYMGSPAADVLQFSSSAGTERMRIDSSGNVMIGTTSQNGKLTIAMPTGSGTLGIQTGSITSNSVRLEAGGNVTTWLEYRGYLGHAWFVDTTERMRIDSSGNLGLGVTPSAWQPTSKAYEIGSAGTSQGALQITASGYMDIMRNAYVATGGIATYKFTGYATSYRQDPSGQHVWYTAPSGTAGNAITFTQAMTLNSGGNLGIGTSSPSSRLHVYGSNPSLRVEGDAGSYYPEIRLDGANGTMFLTTYYGATITATNATGNNTIRFRNGGTTSAGAYGGSDRMIIDSSGNVLIGTTSANGQLCVTRNNYYSPAIYVSIGGTTSGGGNFATLKQTSGDYGNAYITIDRGRTDYLAGFEFLTGGTLDFTFGCGGNPGVGGGNSLQLRNSSGTRVFDINSSNGNVQNQNNSYGSLSDVKLKENITNATPKLEKLNELRVVNYNLIGDSLKQIGLIAQEVELVFPGLVETQVDIDGDGNDLGTTTKAVKYSVFVPMLIQAVQELKAIVDAQAARIAALEGTQP